jgi:tetraacyldisaccharide 4'-kinase
VWNSGAALRALLYEAGWTARGQLGSKVVSVGNIAWGGTGKTPFVIWLAQRLNTAGLRTSILTRGYRRTSQERVRVLPPGSDAKTAVHDGDEVQLYLRHLPGTAVGIAASRLQAGRELEKRFQIDLHLLDDGFQHLALMRDLDIVLIDASNPWGGRAGFPSLLRESPRALKRASAIVLTHCESSSRDQIESLQSALRRYNAEAPQFLASTRLLHLASTTGGHSRTLEEVRNTRCLAFCGIGSPGHFLRMLEQSGLSCVAHRFFGDHHRYSASDLEQLENRARSSRADCLITTEKDVMNLSEQAHVPLPLYFAEIGIEVQDEGILLAWLGDRLGLSLQTTGEQQRPAGQALQG